MTDTYHSWVNRFELLTKYLLLALLFSCENEKENQLNLDILDQHKAYIIYRGTDTKQGFYAKDFNVKDTLATHVGLLFRQREEWVTYHVYDTKNPDTDLKIESLNDFLDVDDGHVYYLSILEIRGIYAEKLEKLISILDQYKNFKIQFDRSFMSDEPTKLYCSEFVVEVLSGVDSLQYRVQQHKKELLGVYKLYFQQDSLEYYPVDAFRNNPNFREVGEWYLE